MTLPSDVLFEYDRCAINPESYVELRKVAKALQAHPEWGNIRVEGHASYEGVQKDDYNLRLSRCRASRIARFLAYYGVAEQRLSYLGFGYRCPAVPNNSDANRRRNRRVEFVRNPEGHLPRCELPPQLDPLPKHAAEPELYRTPEAESAMPPAGKGNTGPAAQPPGSQGSSPAAQPPGKGTGPAAQPPGQTRRNAVQTTPASKPSAPVHEPSAPAPAPKATSPAPNAPVTTPSAPSPAPRTPTKEPEKASR